MMKILLIIYTYFFTTSLILGQANETTLTQIGEKAPSFVCKTIQGKTIDLNKMGGKIVMINFFATWCTPCILELSFLQNNIWDKYKNNKNFELVILGREHNERQLAAFASKKNFSLPFAPDPKREIFDLYAIKYIPRNILIDEEGRIFYQSIPGNQDDLKMIENLIAKKLKETKF